MKYIIKKIEFGWICYKCCGYEENNYPLPKGVECCGLCKGVYLKTHSHFCTKEHYEKCVRYPMTEICENCGDRFGLRFNDARGLKDSSSSSDSESEVYDKDFETYRVWKDVK